MVVHSYTNKTYVKVCELPKAIGMSVRVSVYVFVRVEQSCQETNIQIFRIVVLASHVEYNSVVSNSINNATIRTQSLVVTNECNKNPLLIHLPYKYSSKKTYTTQIPTLYHGPIIVVSVSISYICIDDTHRDW